MTRIRGTLCEDLCTVMIVCPSVLLATRNISDKICRENQNTPFVFNDFFSPESRAVYEIMRKNVEPDRPRMTISFGSRALHAA